MFPATHAAWLPIMTAGCGSIGTVAICKFMARARLPRRVANGLISNRFQAYPISPLARPGQRGEKTAMTLSIIIHPLATFVVGVVVALAAVFLFFSLNTLPNRSSEDMADYRKAMEKVVPSGLMAGSPGEIAALDRFKSFLQGIGDKNYVHENTLKSYSADAYLDDTLVVHHGSAEIEAYFLKTSETMTSYQVTIDDTVRSGDDFYIRWTMIFSAPAMSGGKPVHSTGISQIRFNREGKVAFHRDFWDSGRNFFAHLPVSGGAIGFIRKRLESN